MADTTANEAATAQTTDKEVSSEHYADAPAIDYHGDPPRPGGFLYKSYTVFGYRIPWYASPSVQLTLVSWVCFMCPGMFNALSGLGGGGRADKTLADHMNIALYSTFAVIGFTSGTFVNWVGIRISMSIGGTGYCLYAISLLVSVHKHVPGFNIFAGAWLGFCAGILWAAQGSIMLAYPTEEMKGRYWAWFWGIFNIGACIGSLIALGTNMDAIGENVNVKDGTYIAFIVLMGFGAILALGLVDAKKVIRSDGSKVILKKNPSLWSEMVGLYDTLRFNPYVILLFPMFWSSNWFYAYQMNAINGAYFDTRTKGLNGFLYWFAQIIAALFLGPLLDLKYLSRRVRAISSLIFLFVVTMAVWGGGYAWQKKYTRETVDPGSGFIPWDWTHRGYVGPMFLYIFYGMYDGVWQGCVYWYMGALSNSGRNTANLVGFYKGIQSAGAAVMWSLDSNKLSYMNELASNWALLAGSIVCAAPVILLQIKDHVSVEDEASNAGANLAEVLPDVTPEKYAE